MYVYRTWRRWYRIECHQRNMTGWAFIERRDRKRRGTRAMVSVRARAPTRQYPSRLDHAIRCVRPPARYVAPSHTASVDVARLTEATGTAAAARYVNDIQSCIHAAVDHTIRIFPSIVPCNRSDYHRGARLHCMRCPLVRHFIQKGSWGLTIHMHKSWSIMKKKKKRIPHAGHVRLKKGIIPDGSPPRLP